ncbi:MAG: HNH endonuclease [Saprospiraceae bacterium]
MSNRYVSVVLRKQVAERAKHRCEYCRAYEKYAFFTYHVEHIVSLKHGGLTILVNLAYSCPVCNKNKGSDIATFLDNYEIPIRFYNPRIDDWEIHFEIQPNGLILPKSKIGEATIKIFDFNHPDSMLEREILLMNGMF